MHLGFELEADEIIPNLWQDSYPRVLSAAEVGFHVVVICAREHLKYRDGTDEYQEHGVRVIEAPFDDTIWPSEDELKIAHWAAAKVVAAVQDGKKVLVTCAAGLNRSGLVTGLAVIKLRGLKGHEAVVLIQGCRENALCNRVFAQYIYNQK